MPFMLPCCVCRRLSSVCLSVTLCIVAKRCVLEQKLLLRVYKKSYNYEKSIGTKMNDLDLCIEVVSRSCQPLIALHSTLNISKTVTNYNGHRYSLVPNDHQ